jgi:hypothetical protein
MLMTWLRAPLPYAWLVTVSLLLSVGCCRSSQSNAGDAGGRQDAPQSNGDPGPAWDVWQGRRDAGTPTDGHRDAAVPPDRGRGPDARVDAGTRVRHYVGYFPSWSEAWFDDRDWSGQPYSDAEILQKSKLASRPDCLSHLLVSFVAPDLSFDAAAVGAGTCTGTGLGFSATCRGIQAAIRVARSRGQTVLLAVGGSTYSSRWRNLAAEAGQPIESAVHKKALRDLLDYLGADGLDVDYEAEGGPGSAVADEYAKAILAMREAVEAATKGRRLLTLAGWSTGADCTSNQLADPSANAGCLAATYWGGSGGRERDVLQRKIAASGTGASFAGKTTIADLIDEISIMSYDARYEHFDPTKAFKLYRAIFPTKNVNIGLETAPEGWAGAILVCNNDDASASWPGTIILKDQESLAVNQPYSVERSVGYVRDHDTIGGAMLWHLFKYDNVPPGACNPDGIHRKVSEILGFPLPDGGVDGGVKDGVRDGRPGDAGIRDAPISDRRTEDGSTGPCGKNTFDCQGVSPDPEHQPVVPGTRCCCFWGMKPQPDKTCA